jgi:two-component system nitrate/nitrite response regulator NarL
MTYQRPGGPPREDISVLVVDDHRIFADVLASRLVQEPGVREVTPAYALDEARVLARRMQPDLVLLDYHVKDEVGTTLIPELRALDSAPAVVMLSATDEPQAVVDSLESGASGWVMKGARVEVLMQATDDVLNGRMYLYPTTVRPVVERLLRQSRPTRQPSFLDQLSARQVEVLRCLVAGMTRAETAQRLYITANTVRTHAQALLRAADEHSTLALVARARQLGVVGIDDPDPEPRPSSR